MGYKEHTHVRFAVAHVCVRAKCILKCVCDVRAYGPFLGGAMCDRTFAHFFAAKGPEFAKFQLFSLTFLYIQGCSKTEYDVLKQERMF